MSVFAKKPERPLKWRLFGYMMSLVLLLLLALVVGLFLIGRFGSVTEKTYETLQLQMRVFEKEITSYYDNLSYRAIQLSGEMTLLLENYLQDNDSSFEDLTDDPEKIAAVQEVMFEPLRQKLQLAQCSGAFVILDTTINSTIPDAQHFRSGLYLQPCDYITSDADVLLYRGIADIGKRHDAMPHRKWRQEFRSDTFPGYEEIAAEAALPLESAYRITDLVTLPGTSERAMLLTVPLLGADGSFYGICGFEINESSFKRQHAQATNLEHLICLLAAEENGMIRASVGLSAGIDSGYYFAPKYDLTLSGLRSGLSCFSGDIASYVGMKQELALYQGAPEFILAVMIPKVDYDRELASGMIQFVFLLLFIAFFAVTCCLFFSRRFLRPVLQGLERLKNRKEDEGSVNISEIDDLFRFLAVQDREYEQVISLLEQEKRDAASKQAKMQTEYEAAQAEIARLAYARDKEIDPDDYRQFLDGIKNFTPAERKVFHYYLDGKGAKEIQELMSIKESTLRYHNRNIYQKLGVNSLKQMLRYAALMKQKSQEGGEEE